MQIQLKQAEIERALQMYITAKGIDLNGKRVSINFTAGRRQTGITATMQIDQSGYPGYSDAPVESHVEDAAAAPSGPSLSVVKAEATPEVAETKPATEDQPEDTPQQAPETKPTTSLFGGN